ncbi:hypothetical protein [Streptomyces sp. NPDC059262]|uniref:hypothetical protein n=1 Tax=Streptomyces sp. NPDC059262 TaxID=3346797 RepID=UPI003681A61E
MQTILRHAHLSTTALYTTVRLDDLLDRLAEHYRGPAEPARWSATYDADDMRRYSVTDSAVGPSMRPHVTSNRIRCHAAEPATSLQDGRLTQIVPEPPPVPDRPPRPLGELSSTTVDQIVALVADEFADVSRNARADCKHGMRRLLHRLAAEPGQTRQERWEGVGLSHAGRAIADLADGDPKWRSRLTRAAGIAFAMRLIHPTEDALRATNAPQYTEKFPALSRDPLPAAFRTRLQRHPVSAGGRKSAIRHRCRALTVYGIGLADLTPGVPVYYANAHPGCGIASAWPLLRDMGVLPAWVPHTLQDARVRGRQSVDDLVDRHQLHNREVRDLLVNYIRRRAVDYGTLDNLVRNLDRHFWKIVEEINPDQANLRLGEEIVQAWKERLLVRQDGKPRQHIDGPFLAVRAFYPDLQTWSAAEPERWGRWVASCPIRDADLRWFHIRRRRLQERMAANRPPANASDWWRSSPSTSPPNGTACAPYWTWRNEPGSASSSPSAASPGNAPPARPPFVGPTPRLRTGPWDQQGHRRTGTSDARGEQRLLAMGRGGVETPAWPVCVARNSSS